MTITNHVRHIQNLAELLIENVDERKYRHAHDTIAAIEERARLAHEHIDNLQMKADCAARPAGKDP